MLKFDETLARRLEANPGNTGDAPQMPDLDYAAARTQEAGRRAYFMSLNPYPAGSLAFDRWAAGFAYEAEQARAKADREAQKIAAE